MKDGKQGVELIIDRVEALRVRIEHFNATVEGYDHATLSHWGDLAKEALAEAVPMHTAFERITALLALPASAPIADIVKAVEHATRRCEQLEYRMLEIYDARENTKGPPGQTVGDLMAPLHRRIEELEAALAGKGVTGG